MKHFDFYEEVIYFDKSIYTTIFFINQYAYLNENSGPILCILSENMVFFLCRGNAFYKISE